MTERIALVTDSTCDMPAELLRQEDIRRVALSVFFGDQEYLDGEELSAENFYKMLPAAPIHPTTSQPSAGKFLNLFEQLKTEQYTHVLCLHISRKLSGTVQAAQAAARMVSGLQLQIIDSKTITWGLGLLLLHARKLIRQGMPFADLCREIQNLTERPRIFFTTDSLDALCRGGRIGKAQAFFGKCLGIRPIMVLRGTSGEIEAVSKTRSLEETLNTIVGFCRETISTSPLIGGVVILHAAQPVHSPEILRRMQADPIFGSEIRFGPIGPVVGTHLGPEGWGIVLF